MSLQILLIFMQIHKRALFFPLQRKSFIPQCKNRVHTTTEWVKELVKYSIKAGASQRTEHTQKSDGSNSKDT